MLPDIGSASTAAQVIGGYTFDIKLASVIYLTIMVALLAEAKYCRKEKLADYSSENVRNIIEQYLAETPENAPQNTADIVSPVNLSIIMNERWADLRIIGSFELERV